MFFCIYWGQKVQDRVVGALEATHLADGKTGILIQGIGEEDHALHMVGGQMIMTHIGGVENAPCQLVVVATPGRANQTNPLHLLSH